METIEEEFVSELYKIFYSFGHLYLLLPEIGYLVLSLFVAEEEYWNFWGDVAEGFCLLVSELDGFANPYSEFGLIPHLVRILLDLTSFLALAKVTYLAESYIEAKDPSSRARYLACAASVYWNICRVLAGWRLLRNFLYLLILSVEYLTQPDWARLLYLFLAFISIVIIFSVYNNFVDKDQSKCKCKIG